ncbi:MAG: ABC transporter substrate-binding protein [Longispora sp.]|nr:ABC transporter substrate-binding protein [Longispora sp. (in: high G+C Gram-positive bacteria)]
MEGTTVRKPSILVGALSLIITAGMAGCATKEQAALEEIKIGASIELSGETSSIGTIFEKALKLKVEQVNRDGGVNGRKINLIIKDNRSDPAEGLKNINHLIDHEHVSAIISGGCSACVISAKEVANTKKVPVVALGAASAITSPVNESRYVFKISPSPAESAEVVIAELKRKGVTKIGLISVKNVYGQEGKAQILTRANAADIDVISDEFSPDDRDMTSQVNKLVSGKPGAIVAWAVMPAAGLITQAVRNARYAGKLYLDSGAGVDLFIQGAQDAAENTFMVFPGIVAINDTVATTPQVATQKIWVKDYASRYGVYSGLASFGADAVQLVVNAVAATGDTDPQRLRDEIENATLDGMSGPIRMSAINHSGLQAAALKIVVVKNGEWRLAS